MVIVCIFLVIRLVPFLREAAEGDIPINSVFTLLLLNLVTYLDLIIPLMGFIAVLVVTNAWISSNEMTIIFSSGIEPANFLKPLVVLMLILVSIVAALSFYISPWSVRYSLEIENDFKARADVTGIVPGQFLEAAGNSGIYFIEGQDDATGQYTNVFSYSNANNKDGIVNAKYAYKYRDNRTGDMFLALKNGTRYEGIPGEPDYKIIEYETYAIRIDDANPPPPPGIPLKGQTNEQLLDSDNPQSRTELMWRLSKSLIVPVLMLNAIAFNNVQSRHSRLTSMLAALFVYFSYTNFVSYVTALMKKGSLNTSWLLWLAHGIFLLLGAYMFYRSARNKPFLPRLSRNGVYRPEFQGNDAGHFTKLNPGHEL